MKKKRQENQRTEIKLYTQWSYFSRIKAKPMGRFYKIHFRKKENDLIRKVVMQEEIENKESSKNE